jgi:hypothetical protein
MTDREGERSTVGKALKECKGRRGNVVQPRYIFCYIRYQRLGATKDGQLMYITAHDNYFT